MSNEKKTLADLKARAKAFDVQLPFMEDRDKGETNELIGQISTITDYGFIPNTDGEPYVVFITKERSNKFYFGGSVLTKRMLEMEQDGFRDVILEHGLPVLFTEEKSKTTKRNYVNVKFYPEG